MSCCIACDIQPVQVGIYSFTNQLYCNSIKPKHSDFSAEVTLVRSGTKARPVSGPAIAKLFTCNTCCVPFVEPEGAKVRWR